MRKPSIKQSLSSSMVIPLGITNLPSPGSHYHVQVWENPLSDVCSSGSLLHNQILLPHTSNTKNYEISMMCV